MLFEQGGLVHLNVEGNLEAQTKSCSDTVTSILKLPNTCMLELM